MSEPATPPPTAAPGARSVPDARDSDPQRLGWMQGSPPPPAKRIRFEDGSHYRFPQYRWSFSHWRELRPTVAVSNGEAPIAPLPLALRDDLDDVRFLPLDGGAARSWAESLALNYTDGILVLHRGRVVQERYFGALTPRLAHMAFSVTKSLFGLLGALLIEDGTLDPALPVARLVPELAPSGFGDATVLQVLEMTTAVDFVEDYAALPPTLLAYQFATGLLPRPALDKGPRTLHELLPTIGKAGEHGAVMTYRTPNTDVLAWVLARASGRSPAQLLEERLWSQLGAEAEASLALDEAGTPLAGAGLNARLRDLARLGEMMRLGGMLGGRRVLPQAVVTRIVEGGDRAAFPQERYPTLPGWSYHHQWWIAHDAHGCFAARGIHGQGIYVDPRAEMVIARFASSPLAGNTLIDPVTLPAYRALGQRLVESPDSR